jgi:hypothetical protein
LIEVGTGGPDGSGSGGRRREALTATGRIRLSPEENRVFRKVDGVRTVQAIVDGTGASEFEVCRSLFDFLNRNLIAPEGRGEAPVIDEERAERVSPLPGYAVAALVSALALGGLVTTLGSPFAVTGRPPVVAQAWGEVADGVTWQRLFRLDQSIEAWKATHGTPPSTLQDLVAAGLVHSRFLKDAVGRPFHYEATSDGYLLSAADDGGRAVPERTLDRREGSR